MTFKRVFVIGASVLTLALAGFLIYQRFSPHHICLRYYQEEGVQSGMRADVAADYAEGLCTSKNPFRD
ncbi:MAG: hypothetical protein QNI90_03355 [Dinoroseobacter sp.]|nr:hypothetical protein [Dinoroseobacter sp.]